MSLEQAILDRLEKRNEQIAQLQSTVHALERAADFRREQATMECERLLEENKKRAERIERMEESEASADMLRKSLNDEITKRDRELREMDAEAKAHREAIQKKDSEIQEWLMQLANARNERDAALREAESMRSQVPLESTREALKNAVAKLQEVTTDRDRVLNDLAAIYAEANKSGYCNGDPVAQIKKGQHDFDKVVSLSAQLQAATTRADSLVTCRDRWMKIAADCGRMDGEDVGEFIARLAQQAAHGAELAVKVEELRVENIESKAAFERVTKERDLILDAAKSRDVHTKDALDIAHAYGQKPYESLGGFIGRVCMEREEIKAERLRLNAKVGPLETLYVRLNDYCRENSVRENAANIYHQVAAAKSEIDRLTA